MLRFLASIILLTLLSCSPLKTLQELPEVKAWEPDIEKFEALDMSQAYPADAVLFAGSSSIRRWSTIAADMSPYNVIQRGYGGAKLTDFTVYADRIFRPHKCSAAVVFIGNDITGTKQDKSPEEVRKLFLGVLKTFRKTHKDTPFFWIAVTPTPSRWKAWPQIKEASGLIKKECNRHHDTYFINTDSAFLDANGKPRGELFIEDKLHLNAEGYKIWSSVIRKELDKILNN